jgi:hypothetical protein
MIGDRRGSGTGTFSITKTIPGAMQGAPDGLDSGRIAVTLPQGAEVI